MDIFKKYDIIDELDSRIHPEENVFIECSPNKLPYIFRLIKPYIFIELLVVFIDVLYGILRPQTLGVFLQGFELFLIALNCVPIYFLAKSLYAAILEVKHVYYVITDQGIHILKGGKSLDYMCYHYEEVRSFTLNKFKLSKNKGSIILKEVSEREIKGLINKFFYIKTGLIAVDEVQKIYDILKQIAVQENPNIFFADDSTDLPVDYYRDVKKYNKKIDVDKDDSIIKRRS